jgi:hypothetical protein
MYMANLVHYRTYSYNDGRRRNRTSVTESRVSRVQLAGLRDVSRPDQHWRLSFGLPGFRWRPPLSRGHNKVFAPLRGRARKGKGQGGFLIILVPRIWMQYASTRARPPALEDLRLSAKWKRALLGRLTNNAAPTHCYTSGINLFLFVRVPPCNFYSILYPPSCWCNSTYAVYNLHLK